MFERFTGEARAAVVGAQEQARALGASRIEPQHLLLGLAAGGSAAADALAKKGVTVDRMRTQLAATGLDTTGLDTQALAAIGIDLDRVRAAAEAQLGPGVLDPPASPRKHIPFTKPAKKVLELSLREAVAARCREVGADAVLLGLLREGTVTSLIAQLGGKADALAADAGQRLRARAA